MIAPSRFQPLSQLEDASNSQRTPPPKDHPSQGFRATHHQTTPPPQETNQQQPRPATRGCSSFVGRMEDLAPQLGGILVGGTSTDEPNSQSSLYSASIGVPVTLVVSGGLPDQSDMEVHSNAMLSTLALQSDDGCGPATQLFLEHLADGQARLKTADGHTLEVDIDPRTIGLVHGNSGVPVLLQVSPDGMLLQRDDVQIALAASGAAAENSTDTTEEQREDAGSSTPCEDSEPMFQDAEHLPLRMYFEVAKETADENSASMEDVQTNTGTAVAIVTPDGDESDADELPAPVSSLEFGYVL
ncbi:hypothetical protein HPB51_018469 [Rhipicephalus microplus]|uniref:Uncharacterized protein n=1 Tax=Rhipicephalus microplus TaxID=6941 RepID=A0A9J6DBD9_RHIMP|nr:hypothetical protein HPB51_018469 [Rhipicephalus microplus]